MTDSIDNPLLPGSSEVEEDALYMCGYLFKEARNGKWQKRWFETNGPYLTYYKSSQMEKLLAALSIPQVGAINRLPAEAGESGVRFSLELSDRSYILRAATEAEAARWIDVLESIRTAVQAETGAQEKATGSRLSSVDHTVASSASMRDPYTQTLPQVKEDEQSEPEQVSPRAATPPAPPAQSTPTVTVSRASESLRPSVATNDSRQLSTQTHTSRTVSQMSVERWASVDLKEKRQTLVHRPASTWDKSHRACCGCL